MQTWEEVASARDWRALFLGNGSSINTWSGFRYGSLYAKAEGTDGPLSDDDLAIFDVHETENFEVALHALSVAIRTAEACGQPIEPYIERYNSIRDALAYVLRNAHLELVEVPEESRAALRAVLDGQRVVFTTNYDLLVYWAMGYNNDYGALVDCLFYGRFDPRDCEPASGKIPIYYLHGAMHLVVTSDDVTRKIVRGTHGNVLDQFGKPFDGDGQARPLLVTEGSWRDKLRAIRDNDYLRHCFRQLRDSTEPLVVFGSRLSKDQDEHLIRAINRSERPVAVSIRDEGERRNRQRMAEVRAALATDELWFFDAQSHPLGVKNWSTEVERVRAFKASAPGAFGRPVRDSAS